MAVTINQSATTLTFSHSNLSSNIVNLGLTVKHNCSSTPSVFNLQSKIAGITNNSFEFTKDDYYGNTTTAKFADGVYYLELTFTYMNNTDVVTKTIKHCFVNDYDLKCLYLNSQSKSYDNYLAKQYESLILADTCDDCNCATTCSIYNDILDTLTTNSNTTIYDTNCGCQ